MLSTSYISDERSRNKSEAEVEIIKHVRLTDYYQQCDTMTVSEELVADAD